MLADVGFFCCLAGRGFPPGLQYPTTERIEQIYVKLTPRPSTTETKRYLYHALAGIHFQNFFLLFFHLS